MVVETLSQDEPGLTALTQEAEHQKEDQLEGIMGIGGQQISLREDNLSFSPRNVRLQKSAARAVVSIYGYETKESSVFGGCGVVSSTTFVTGLATLDRGS